MEEISLADLHRALERVEGKKPTQRLLAAIAYKHGVTQTELAAWHDVQRRTIYGWLERFADDSPERAVTDDDRPGRPRKLSGSQQKRLDLTLHAPPAEVGYEATAWTPALVGEWLRETFGVDYSEPSCRRLMKEAGLRYRDAEWVAVDADPDG